MKTDCNLLMNEIFLIGDLAELEVFFSKQNTDEIRETLFDNFLRYSDYKNATEWNKAVRICECLAIIGWGEHEPLQAVRGQFFNGNPTTGFYNKFKEPRFVDAIWSKRKDGLTMENDRTTCHFSPDLPSKQTVSWNYPVIECVEDLKLSDQRNWIPLAPIYIGRGISNCYENSKAVIESIENDLQAKLDLKMTPEKYGRVIKYICFHLVFSYFDNAHNKMNLIIADEKLGLKQKDFYNTLLTMYSEKDVKENGYFLRNRYEYGSFRNGVCKVVITFEKELSEMEHNAQKQKIAFHVEEALGVALSRLKKKKIKYDFDLMQSDFLDILNEWCARV